MLPPPRGAGTLAVAGSGNQAILITLFTPVGADTSCDYAFGQASARVCSAAVSGFAMVAAMPALGIWTSGNDVIGYVGNARGR